MTRAMGHAAAVATAPTGPAEPTGGAVAVLRRVERASGALATQAVGRMHATLPWFGPMPAEHRAGVGLVVQVGITSFVEWCRRPEHAREVSVEVFRVAPRNLIRAVSLQQVVELVRIAVETVESAVPGLAGPAYEQQLRADVLRYSRDIAFAAAGVYTRAAEERGAWDARLEALVVDHVLRGDVDVALPSRAAALGWGNPPAVTVVVGVPPDAEPETVIDEVHRVARTAGLEVLTGVHSERLVVVVGGAFDPGLRGAPRRWRRRGRCCRRTGPGRSSSGRRPPTWPARRPRHGPRWPPQRRSRDGRTRPGRSRRPTCSLSGRWPATATRAASWWRRSTSRSGTPAPPCCGP